MSISYGFFSERALTPAQKTTIEKIKTDWNYTEDPALIAYCANAFFPYTLLTKTSALNKIQVIQKEYEDNKLVTTKKTLSIEADGAIKIYDETNTLLNFDLDNILFNDLAKKIIQKFKKNILYKEANEPKFQSVFAITFESIPMEDSKKVSIRNRRIDYEIITIKPAKFEYCVHIDREGNFTFNITITGICDKNFIYSRLGYISYSYATKNIKNIPEAWLQKLLETEILPLQIDRHSSPCPLSKL